MHDRLVYPNVSVSQRCLCEKHARCLASTHLGCLPELMWHWAVQRQWRTRRGRGIRRGGPPAAAVRVPLCSPVLLLLRLQLPQKLRLHMSRNKLENICKQQS